MKKRKKGVLHCWAGVIQTTKRNSLNKSRDLIERQRVQTGVSDELKGKIDRGRCSEERAESRCQQEVLLFVGGPLRLPGLI
jgi:hypothetical protein